MQKAHIISDVDGVLIDLVQMFLKVLQDQFGFAPKPEEIHHYHLRHTLAKTYGLGEAEAQLWEDKYIEITCDYSPAIAFPQTVEAFGKFFHQQFRGNFIARSNECDGYPPNDDQFIPLQFITARKEVSSTFRQIASALPKGMHRYVHKKDRVLLGMKGPARIDFILNSAHLLHPTPVLYFDDHPDAIRELMSIQIPQNLAVFMPMQAYNANLHNKFLWTCCREGVNFFSTDVSFSGDGPVFIMYQPSHRLYPIIEHAIELLAARANSNPPSNPNSIA